MLTKQQRLQSNWFCCSALPAHVQCAQAMAMNTAVTGPFWFHMNGRILLKIIWNEQIATPKDVIRGLLFGGESRHAASPPPFVQCWSHLWVEKFVGFNGREEDKNGASKAFISKLKINSWAWADWTNRQIPCLIPLSQCQFKHLQHCTKKLESDLNIIQNKWFTFITLQLLLADRGYISWQSRECSWEICQIMLTQALVRTFVRLNQTTKLLWPDEDNNTHSEIQVWYMISRNIRVLLFWGTVLLLWSKCTS